MLKFGNSKLSRKANDLEPCFAIMHELDSHLREWMGVVAAAVKLQDDSQFQPHR